MWYQFKQWARRGDEQLHVESVVVDGDQGHSLLVELWEIDTGFTPAGRTEERLTDLAGSIHQVVAAVSEVAGRVRSGLAEHRPDEVQIEFGLKLAAEAGIIVSKSTIEAQVQVRLTWSAE